MNEKVLKHLPVNHIPVFFFFFVFLMMLLDFTCRLQPLGDKINIQPICKKKNTVLNYSE